MRNEKKKEVKVLAYLFGTAQSAAQASSAEAWYNQAWWNARAAGWLVKRCLCFKLVHLKFSKTCVYLKFEFQTCSVLV